MSKKKLKLRIQELEAYIETLRQAIDIIEKLSISTKVIFGADEFEAFSPLFPSSYQDPDTYPAEPLDDSMAHHE